MEITKEVVEAADKVFGFDSDEERDLITAVLEAAGPLIVADYLERLAGGCELVADGTRDRESASVHRDHVRVLRSEAAELRGGHDA